MSAELSPAQREEKPNNTGLPNQLKSGIESLSGMSMDHVEVHYNSDKPAQLQAHAYAQGNEIHLGAGQERHLPHEAWHVVQQAQGRVRPTLQMKAGAVNDDPSLENEADMMGEKAVQFEGDFVNNSSHLIAQRQVSQAETTPREALENDGTAVLRLSNHLPVLQRTGEIEAMNHAISREIRRGNRRDSITQTEGTSLAWLNVIREKDSILGWLKTAVQEDDPLRAVVGRMEFDEQFYNATLSNITRAGNCLEFASLMYVKLRELTTAQCVYVAKMMDFDHAFTMTTPGEDLYASVAELDSDTTTVIDGWNNYKIQTLRQFCEGDNPTQQPCLKERIEIVDSTIAQGDELLSPEMEVQLMPHLEELFDAFMTENGAGVQQIVAGEAGAVDDIHDFSRPDVRAVDDTRPPPPPLVD